METRSFTVPQSYCAARVHNAFQADLARNGSHDWAVLCSRADSSRIVVFWSGSTDSTTEFHLALDHYYVCNGKAYGYSRVIGPSSAQHMRERYEAYEAEAPSHIDHDILEDSICEKGSTALYWRDGVIEELQGAD
jgi:hypothetical protein